MEKGAILNIMMFFKETVMKQVVTVRNLTIGEGMPKICVPIVATTEEEIIKKDQCRRIREALSKLEEPYKDVFILHVLGEIKLKEIADMYGKTESWAKVTYFRAKAKITALMESE